MRNYLYCQGESSEKIEVDVVGIDVRKTDDGEVKVGFSKELGASLKAQFVAGLS